MSEHGLTAENILTTFPIALQGDTDVAALAEVTARLLARRPEEIDRLRIYSDINRLDEKLLDILAYDYKVDWWNPNYTVEEKRRTLADSWHVHKILGTKAAVEMAIRDIYPKTDVQEWFEYEDGKPYHFKLNIDLTDTFGDETRPWSVLERVNFYKSLRSHLDAIVFTITTTPTALHVGGGFGAVVSMGIPMVKDLYDFQSELHTGGAFGSKDSIGIPPGIESFDFQQTVRTGGKFGENADIGVPEKLDVLHTQTALHAGGAAGIHFAVSTPEDSDRPDFSQALHTGGYVSEHMSLSVPEDAAPPSSTTILRTGGVGGVCTTIISNLSKGE
ncbi:MAG: phage tail protein I [Oscillospiraceae bacterium]|nr:phage tail protein I [Oscillospiraceae bacterium]